MQLESTLTCPACGHLSKEQMPTDACQFFYDCAACGTQLKPKAGDCCVFCSYGDVPCPPIQQDGKCYDNAPSHRIYVGRAEIGAAWSKRSEEDRDYLSRKLDNPSFNVPIYANLLDDEGGEGYTLLCSRPRKNAE